MTWYEYELIQKKLSSLKTHPYWNRAEREAFKQGILACKSAVHRYRRDNPDECEMFPEGGGNLADIIKVLDGIEANMKYKHLKKEEREPYLAAINDCRSVVAQILF